MNFALWFGPNEILTKIYFFFHVFYTKIWSHHICTRFDNVINFVLKLIYEIITKNWKIGSHVIFPNLYMKIAL